jgi:hypothetical protein
LLTSDCKRVTRSLVLYVCPFLVNLQIQHVLPYNISDILLDLMIKHPSVKMINKEIIILAQLAKDHVRRV